MSTTDPAPASASATSGPGPAAVLAGRNGTLPGFAWFAGGVGSWFGAWGMQQVLFSWIVVGELAAESEWVGIAQTSTMLPSTFLVLAGGAVADRFDPRRLLAGLHVVAAVPVLLLAWASARGFVSLGVLIGYGLLIGTVQAFTMPARDTLLSRVAGTDMMRAVTTMTAVQFGCQAGGALLAGFARLTGSPVMLAVQSLVFLAGAGMQRGVPKAVPRTTPAGRVRASEIVEGVRIVFRTERLWAPAALVVSVGVFFIGPYLVVFPLLVRDGYGLGVDALSLVLMLFPVGTIIGSLVLRVRGVGRKGMAALGALLAGAGVEAVIGFGVSFPVMAGLTLIWGLGGAVFINCSRTLFQEAAPVAERGRVLAVYQLGFMGGAPVGTLLAGFAVAGLGLHGTLIAAALAMTLLVLAMATLTGTPSMR